MALANKELQLHNSRSSMGAIIQASAFYEHDFGPKLDMYGAYQEPESPVKNSSTVSSPSSSNSNGGAGLIYNLSEEGHSVINFKPEYGNFGSCLSFDQTKRGLVYPKLMLGAEDPAAVWDVPWLNDQEILDTDHAELPDTTKNKRPSSTGENEQCVKKQCVAAAAASKKTKPKPESTSKDPQSVAAKNRRERISERLKILQELVPNGSKVDLVTMLEKAIGYVKFLQLQVKVLATDEFWPAQGGKAPDLCQVREAIDAILASQTDRNSTSKS